ncbi:hypothetical protein B0H66DRAFT_590132 [Apodospora peruviana]|uniref:Uncharacterized protein n=1 Tax=Apodospora peruviana TaxID=516989 RepID=A0AAE0M838_9PEZI|nr:hypothetical protein B0H66DRAFT_590132 [Apodospora peruviana]
MSLFCPAAALLRWLSIILLIYLTMTPARAQQNATRGSDSTDAEPPAAVTRVVQVFYIDERVYEGLPYTLFHRDSGSVVGVDADRTTYVITTTRVDQRPRPTHSRVDNVTTGIPTLVSSQRHDHMANGTGQPSTITQGPATFMFTGTRFGPNHTVFVSSSRSRLTETRVNQCSLNGTVAAACNLTYVGDVWYTSNADWNGTYSTYSYNWTSGDRFGFASVTITQGAELLAEASPTASGMPNAAVGKLLLAGDALRGVLLLGTGIALGVMVLMF